ncbi:MAG: PEP-CTERM sorting domain-containing protein [Sphingomonadaceae bacterium]
MTRLALVPAAIAALLASASAQAAIVTINFNLFAQDASLIGSGSLSYDNAILDGAGDGVASPTAGSLTISATIFGIPFTEVNDIDYADFPLAFFSGFLLTGIDYILINGVNGSDFTGALFGGLPVVSVNAGSVTGIGDDGTYNITGFVGTAGVPAPAALALFGLGLLGVAAARRRA